uniref:Interferon alpha and beta receptor subunit 1 n=1 Tax=Sphenodon punctatus TaxID=8508 RepID=A0A8D0H818_SPHPU
MAALLLVVTALGSAPRCTGQMNLKSPQNVSVHIVNTNFTLKWDWDIRNDPNVTFSAHYQRQKFEDEDYETVLCKNGKLDYGENGTNWTAVSGCQNVMLTECDFSAFMLTECDFSAISCFLDCYNVHIRAQKGEENSQWSSIFQFAPDQIAEIGPPGVQLKSTDGIVKINISPPETNQKRKMWPNDLRYTYRVVYWKNSSNSEPKNIIIFPRDEFTDFAPETTYCLKVQAYIKFPPKDGFFSPEYCITTDKVWNGLPRPAKLNIHALNMKFLLKWDNQYDQNVSFTVQCLSGFFRKLYEDYSHNWDTVLGCNNITIAQCDFSSAVHFSGTYELRVQAMSGSNKSHWNTITFDPKKQNEIGPPSIKVNASNELLRVLVFAPGESENKSMSEFYDLSYRVFYWKNSSDAEGKPKVEKQPSFTIPGLTASTLYCLKVQAFSPGDNKDGHFSSMICVRTLDGEASFLFILGVFGVAILATFIVIMFSFGLYRKIKYVFFPSIKSPSNIENIGRPTSSSPYLLTSEESTEKCCIVDNILIEEETIQTTLKDYNHSKQSSRDSGNYSNEDDTSGSRTSQESSGQYTV